MKILLTYSSKTGNTKKVAEGLNQIMPKDITDFMTVNKVESIDKYDCIFVGYWVDKALPNDEAKVFMESIKNKKVGVFATLGAYPDSHHGRESLENGVNILKSNHNEVISEFICQGKIDERLVEMFKSFPEGHPHYVTEEKLKRYEIAAKHPDDNDIERAKEIFEKGMKENGIK